MKVLLMRRTGMPSLAAAITLLVMLPGGVPALAQPAFHRLALRVVAPSPYPIPGGYQGSPVGNIVVDEWAGRAFTPTSDGAVMVLNAATGKLLHPLRITANYGLLRVDAATSRLFVIRPAKGDVDEISTVDTPSGAIIRNVCCIGPSGGWETMVVDTATGRVFVNWEGTNVGVLDARSGALLCTVSVGGTVGDLVLDQRAGRVYVSFSPAATAAAAAKTVVRVLDARSGAIMRTLSSLSSVTAVDGRNGRLFATDQRRRSVIVDGRSGAILHVLPFGIDGAVVDGATGRVFVLGVTTVDVLVLDANTGAILRRVSVPGTVATIAAVDERRERVWVIAEGPYDENYATGPGHVTVLDAASGAPLGSLPTGHTPFDGAVDKQSGLFFMDDIYDDTVTVIAATRGS